jgi:hypothetical protein
MMKVNVFSSVAQADPEADQYVYHFALLPENSLEHTRNLDARDFVRMLFDDVLTAVEDDANYWDKAVFDRNVFQKFIALMFVNYATTDPVFYGTNKEDYGVAAGRDMSQTPLYRAVAIALRKLEREEPPVLDSDDVISLQRAETGGVPPGPTPANEHLIVGPLNSLAETLRLLAGGTHPRAHDARVIITHALRDLFEQLKNMGVVSPVAAHPAEEVLSQWGADGNPASVNGPGYPAGAIQPIAEPPAAEPADDTFKLGDDDTFQL